MTKNTFKTKAVLALAAFTILATQALPVFAAEAAEPKWECAATMYRIYKDYTYRTGEYKYLPEVEGLFLGRGATIDEAAKKLRDAVGEFLESESAFESREYLFCSQFGALEKSNGQTLYYCAKRISRTNDCRKIN